MDKNKLNHFLVAVHLSPTIAATSLEGFPTRFATNDEVPAESNSSASSAITHSRVQSWQRSCSHQWCAQRRAMMSSPFCFGVLVLSKWSQRPCRTWTGQYDPRKPSPRKTGCSKFEPFVFRSDRPALQVKSIGHAWDFPLHFREWRFKTPNASGDLDPLHLHQFRSLKSIATLMSCNVSVAMLEK